MADATSWIRFPERVVAYEKALRDGLTPRELSAQLGITTQQVYDYARRLPFEQRLRRRQVNQWRPEEDAVLAELAPSTSYKLIAERLGRPYWSVNQRVHQLGIKGRSKSAVQNDRGFEHHWYVDGTGKSSYAGWRGEDWPEARLAALVRDAWTCVMCGLFSPGERFIVVHHVVPWRITEDNSLENLMTLCRSDHMARPEHRATTRVEALELAGR